MMDEFLSQLQKTGEKLQLKDTGTLRLVRDALRQCQQSDDRHKRRYVLEKFAKYTIPHRELIMAQREDGAFDREKFEVFLDKVKDSELLSQIGLHRYWAVLPAQSQLNVWKFVKQLLTVATAILSMPEPFLNQVESMVTGMVAQQDAAPSVDPSAMISMLGRMMSFGPPRLEPE